MLSCINMASELLTDQRNFLTLESLKKGFFNNKFAQSLKFKIFHGFSFSFLFQLFMKYEILENNGTLHFPKILKINKIGSKISNFNVLKTF